MSQTALTDYRALCAELVDALAEQDRCWMLIKDARAALAQPVPVAPTASDVTELFYRHMGEGSEVGFENAIAEAHAHWGTPTNTINQNNY